MDAGNRCIGVREIREVRYFAPALPIPPDRTMANTCECAIAALTLLILMSGCKQKVPSDSQAELAQNANGYVYVVPKRAPGGYVIGLVIRNFNQNRVFRTDAQQFLSKVDRNLYDCDARTAAHMTSEFWSGHDGSGSLLFRSQGPAQPKTWPQGSAHARALEYVCAHAPPEDSD